MSALVGWYVRVTTGEVVDGVYDTVLYIAGYPTPAEAEAAVRKAPSKSGEQYEVLECDSPIMPHRTLCYESPALEAIARGEKPIAN